MQLTNSTFDFIEQLDQQNNVPSLVNSFQSLIGKFGMACFMIGDPTRPTELVFGEGESAEFVGTKPQEGLLKDIARRTKGEYLPARREVPPLGDWFTRVIEPRPSRELSDDALPQPKERAGWFVGAGLLFLILGWMREP